MTDRYGCEIDVIRGKTLIIDLPGGLGTCLESLDVFLDVVPEALGLLRDGEPGPAC